MRTLEDIFQGEDEQQFLLDCRFDFGKWVTRVLGYDYKWFHREWIEALLSKKRIAILAPTGFGKTTILLRKRKPFKKLWIILKTTT